MRRKAILTLAALAIIFPFFSAIPAMADSEDTGNCQPGDAVTKMSYLVEAKKKYAEAVKSADDKRNKDLTEAEKITDDSQKESAKNKAEDEYKKAQQSARQVFKDAAQRAWEKRQDCSDDKKGKEDSHE